MAGYVIESWRYFECPACGRQERKARTAQVTSELHACPKFNGLATPLVETDGKDLQRGSVRLVRVEREEYVGREIVRTDAAGRPAMAVRTERGDGSNDVHVFAGTARISLRDLRDQNPELAVALARARIFNQAPRRAA